MPWASEMRPRRGPIRGALHLGVAGAFQSLIERTGSGGDQAYADEGVEQSALDA